MSAKVVWGSSFVDMSANKWVFFYALPQLNTLQRHMYTVFRTLYIKPCFVRKFLPILIYFWCSVVKVIRLRNGKQFTVSFVNRVYNAQNHSEKLFGNLVFAKFVAHSRFLGDCVTSWKLSFKRSQYLGTLRCKSLVTYSTFSFQSCPFCVLLIKGELFFCSYVSFFADQFFFYIQLF